MTDSGSAPRSKRRWPPALIGGLVLLSLLVAFAIAAPLFGDPYKIDLVNGREGLRPTDPFSPGFPLGADRLGRNLLPRIAYGSRTALIVALVTTITTLFVSLVVAMTAGFYRGAAEGSLMRLTDVFLTLPYLPAALFIAAYVPSGINRIILIATVLFWAWPARVFYGEVLRLRRRGFVESSEAAGASGGRIMFRHILPFLMPLVLTYAPLNAATAVFLESGLSYIGAGINPPTPSLGKMIAENQGSISSTPHLLIEPALFILFVTLAFVLIGEGLKARNPDVARVSWLAT